MKPSSGADQVIGKQPTEATVSQGLPRSKRLTRSGAFSETYNQGRRWIGRYMVLWLREAPDACLRLGTVSSRKVGGAVQRNRARRKIRTAWRLNLYRFTGNWDVVIVARKSVVTADQAAVESELLRLAVLAGLMSDRDSP